MQAIGDQPIRNNSSSAARITARVLECLAKASIKYNSFIMLPVEIIAAIAILLSNIIWCHWAGRAPFEVPACNPLSIICLMSCHLWCLISYHLWCFISCHLWCVSLPPHITSVSMGNAPAASAAQRWYRCFETMRQLPRQLNNIVDASERLLNQLYNSGELLLYNSGDTTAVLKHWALVY